MNDKSNTWRVYRVLLKGENWWFEDGLLTLRPGESVKRERSRIEASEHLPCYLKPCPTERRRGCSAKRSKRENETMDQMRAYWHMDGDEVEVQNMVGALSGQLHRHTWPDFLIWRDQAQKDGIEVVESQRIERIYT